MRTKKPRGKKPGVITLTEKDVLTICRRHLEAEFNGWPDVHLGSACYVKINKENSKVEFAFEFEE